jgi:hypothetical protein
MLKVTERARKKLEAALHRMTKDPNQAIRMIPSSSMDKDVEFVLDERTVADHIVAGEDGDALLLIGEDWGSDLDGMVLDYARGPDGSQFVMLEDEFHSSSSP